MTQFSFDFRAPDIREDPYPAYHRLRAEAPRWYREERREWVFSRYDDVRFVMKDGRFRFGSPGNSTSTPQPPALARLREQSDAVAHLFLNTIPPSDHVRVRQAVQAPFALPAVESLRPEIERRTEALLDQTDAQQELDLVRDYACPLVLGVIQQILGCAPGHEGLIRRWTTDWFDALDFDAAPVACQRGWFAMAGFAGHLSAELERTKAAPRSDVLTHLAQCREDGQLSNEEALATAILLLSAGHETTQQAIVLGVRSLLRHPEQRGWLERHPEAMRQAADELLRFDGPVQGLPFVAMEEVDYDGILIRQGDRLRLLMGAANRDPDVFPDPDCLDLTRTARPHLAFSAGVHYCLGAELARLEMGVALLALFRRFPDVRMTATAPVWLDRFYLRGFTAFPVGVGPQ